MLSRRDKDQIYDIFQKLYSNTQVVLLLSATMVSDVLEVTKKFMRDPIRILVKKEELTLEGIRQFYINMAHSVTCMEHCPSPRQSSLSTPEGRWTGSLRRCMPEISLFLPCMEIWTKKNEM